MHRLCAWTISNFKWSVSVLILSCEFDFAGIEHNTYVLCL